MVLLEALCAISTTQVFSERYDISIHSLQQSDMSLYSIYDISLCGLQKKKSSLTPVGARVVRSGRVGLDGRPRWVTCRLWLVDAW